MKQPVIPREDSSILHGKIKTHYMKNDELLLKVEEFSNCICVNDLDGAKKLDAVLIEFLGKDSRVVPRKDAPPLLQILYAYNRSMLRLNRDEVEYAILAMVDVAEIIRCYEMWDEVYFVLSMLAENKGRHDKIDMSFQYACDNLLVSIVCQIKFPALSLSLLWNAEKLFMNFFRKDTVEFIKGIRQIQYDFVALEYKNFDLEGAELFEEKAKSLGEINMRISSIYNPIFFDIDSKGQEVLSEDLKKVLKELNEHIPTLEEWGLYWKQFPDYRFSDSMLIKKYGHYSNKENEKLPNLLELLEALSYDEEKYALLYDKSPLGVFFPYHEEWNDLDKVTNNDNELLFLPRFRIKNWYYRGQTSYYEYCQPTLKRLNCKSKVFRERLKLCEFSIIVNKHPVSKMFKLGLSTETRSGDVQHCKIHINDIALAQHYGICTEYMDLTTDKWVAAFFACSDYVNGEGLEKDYYKPHDDSNLGVFYVYKDNSPFESDWKLHPVGIQPNARPIKQSAYAINIQDNQNFNEITCGIRFKHESRCSSIIYKFFNESKGIFPIEVIEKKAKTIVNCEKFSKLALDSARKRFYAHLNDKEFSELLSESTVEVVSNPIIDFSQEEIIAASKEIELVRNFVNLNTSNFLIGTIRLDNS